MVATCSLYDAVAAALGAPVRNVTEGMTKWLFTRHSCMGILRAGGHKQKGGHRKGKKQGHNATRGMGGNVGQPRSICTPMRSALSIAKEHLGRPQQRRKMPYGSYYGRTGHVLWTDEEDVSLALSAERHCTAVRRAGQYMVRGEKGKNKWTAGGPG